MGRSQPARWSRSAPSGTSIAIALRMAIVLVINDDRDMLDVYESVLRSMGHQPVTKVMVESGPDTIRDLGAEALIVDLQQPDEALFGLRVIEEVRRDPELSRLPVILCTAAPEAIRTLRPRLDALDVPVVAKPFALEALEATLETVLRRASSAS
jgi:DNA-binding response OmpR family regulator